MLFDTHCHLDFDVFMPDVAAHINKAQKQGVKRILMPAINISNWQKVTNLAIEYPELYYALGFHPNFLTPDFDLPFMQQQLYRQIAYSQTLAKPCVAIGECGLDYMTDVDFSLQEQVLLMQLKLAKELQLPVILHCRKAHERLLALVKKARLLQGGVIHAFSGSFEQAMNWINAGFYIGVGGVITYPRANKTRLAIAKIPLESIVLETDAPDMPTFKQPSFPNHPQNLVTIFQALAKLRLEEYAQIKQQIWINSNKMFKI